MRSVLLAETTVFAHFQPVRIVFLVLHCVIISLLALGARQCDFGTHGHPPNSVSGAIKKGLESLPEKRYL